jgi:hypothetical protein
MTWSIAAFHEPTGRVAIAVASRFYAAGVAVPPIIHDGDSHPPCDLRDDNHPDPPIGLARLEEVARQRSVHFWRCLSSRDWPSGLTTTTGCEDLISRPIAEGRA